MLLWSQDFDFKSMITALQLTALKVANIFILTTDLYLQFLMLIRGRVNVLNV